MENIDTNEQLYLDINPISKGRRMLVFLGDFFINFILSMFIFNIIVLPIGQVSSQYEEKMEQINIAQEKRDDILYDNNLLFYETESEKHSFNLNLNYTFELYLKYYVFEDENLKKYEVFATYFSEICNNNELYFNLYKDVNSKYNFFDISDNSVKLKQQYKDQLAIYFDTKDELDEAGKNNFQTLLDNVFLFLYSEMLLDMENNNTLNYNAYQGIVDEVNQYYDILLIVCCYVSFIISSLICFIVVPLISKTGKTITMMTMHIERVGMNTLFILKRGERALHSVYHIVFNLAFIMFLPCFVVSFNYLFSLGGFFIISSISMVLILASFVFILVNSYNRSLIDFISQSVLISSDDFDNLARMKGQLK